MSARGARLVNFLLAGRRRSNNGAANKWSADVFHRLRISIGRISRCALFFNSIAKRAAASFRRSALDCWSLVSRSPRPPSRPAAVAAAEVGAAAEEVGAAVAPELELAAEAPELVAAVQAVAAVGVRAAVVQRFTG